MRARTSWLWCGAQQIVDRLLRNHHTSPTSRGSAARLSRTRPTRSSRMPRIQHANLLFVLLTPGMAVAAVDMPVEWRDYAQASVAPAFDWYPARKVRTPTVLDAFAAAPAAQSNWIERAELTSLAQAGAALVGRPEFGPREFTSAFSDQLTGKSFSASYTGSRLGLAAGRIGELGLSAIVARQQFATQGFGAGIWEGAGEPMALGLIGSNYETSSGSGVRVDFGSALRDSVLHWDVAVQSRIEMDAFKTYRGVYSEAGDFDVPGFAKAALAAQLSPRLSLGLEVQRVFYREIDTFSSSALPTRFLSLLGDGGSPEFAWQDLTVYALESRVHDDFHGTWTLRFASQQQPRPTSALLDRALEELYSDRNVSLAYQYDMARAGEFRIGASYSPVTYFLGSSPYRQRGFETGSQVEFEAQWAVSF